MRKLISLGAAELQLSMTKLLWAPAAVARPANIFLPVDLRGAGLELSQIISLSSPIEQAKAGGG